MEICQEQTFQVCLLYSSLHVCQTELVRIVLCLFVVNIHYFLLDSVRIMYLVAVIIVHVS
jgi:hypothetical protein